MLVLVSAVQQCESAIRKYICPPSWASLLFSPSSHPSRSTQSARLGSLCYIAASVCVCTKSLQPCPMLCEPMDCSPPGSSVHVILQATTLEWVAMPSSRGSSRPRDWISASLRLLHRQVGSLPLAPPGKPWVNIWPHNSTPRRYPRELKTYVCKNIQTNVHNNIIHNSQTNQMPINS